MTTNITVDHRAAFEALTSGDYANFELFSCFVNGEPAAAIVAVSQEVDDYAITPLFVSSTPSIILTDHDGQPAQAPSQMLDVAEADFELRGPASMCARGMMQIARRAR